MKNLIKCVFIAWIISMSIGLSHASSVDTIIHVDQAHQSISAPDAFLHQWYKNGEKIEGATKKELKIIETGVYKVENTNTLGEKTEIESSFLVTAAGAIIKIYIIGDSTVSTYNANAYPQAGWGQIIPSFFNTTNLNFTNNAIGGRSSRSFSQEGRWTPIKNALNAGDYVFIQWGHNDRDNSKAERYTSVADYKTYLTMYCNDTKAKGAIPVLISPMVMNAWTGNTMRNVFTENGNNYRGAMLEVATALNVAFVDLNMKSWNLYKSYGNAYNQRFIFKGFVAGEYPNYPNGITDGTHFQEMGAIANARMIVEGIGELSARADMANLIANIKPQYAISIAVNPTGSDILTTKTATYPQGLTITLKTLPKTTSTFQKWNNAGGTQISTKTLTTVTSGTTPTSYTAMYVGATTNPCTSTITSQSNAFCKGGSVVLTANGGSSYKWFNGTTQVGTSSTYSANAAGNYTVEVTNANGCKKTSTTKVITENPLPLIISYVQIDGGSWTNTSSASVCEGSTLKFGPHPSTTGSWNWSGPTNFTSTIREPILASIVSANAGNYIATYTDANGCKATSTFVLQVANPIATITSPNTSICSGGSVVLSASIGSSFKWFNGTTQVGTSSTYSANATGNYTVEVTNNGCKAVSAVKQITENALPVITQNIKVGNGAWAVASSATVCESSIVNFGPHPNIALGWNWTGPNNFKSTLRDPILTSVVTANAGTYTATYTDPNGCKATSDVVLQISKPTAKITAPSTSICTGNSVLLTANAGSSYTFFKGTLQVGTASTLLVSEAGTYTVEVTNNNGCKAVSAPTQITVTNALTWYADTDNDGTGDPTSTQFSCTKPNGYVAIAGDGCPTDAKKSMPGNCGCGKTETECLDCAGTPNGTAVLDNCNICIGGTTGNKECISTGTLNARAANIQVVPQPFDLNTTIKLENQDNIQSITIINVSGAIVKTLHGLNTNEINFGDDLTSGLYSVLIQSEKGLLVTKIIKK